MKKYVIYNDDVILYSEKNKDLIIESLKSYDLPITDQNIIDESYNMINNDYNFLLENIINFDLSNYDYIYVVACLGLWYGSRRATANFKTLHDAILACCGYDSNMLYYEKKNNTLQAASQHHDGCNVYRFYKVVNGKKYAIKYNDLMIY